jgi:hypothetical protein
MIEQRLREAGSWIKNVYQEVAGRNASPEYLQTLAQQAENLAYSQALSHSGNYLPYHELNRLLKV